MAAGNIYYPRVVAKLRRTTTQSIAVSGTWTAINFDAEDADNYGGHDNSTNPDRYTVPKTSTYVVLGSGDFASNSTGMRGVRFTVNGSSVPSSMVTPTVNGDLWSGSIGTIMSLTAGDIVRVEVLQTSGGALNANANAPGFACTLALAEQVAL